MTAELGACGEARNGWKGAQQASAPTAMVFALRKKANRAFASVLEWASHFVSIGGPDLAMNKDSLLLRGSLRILLLYDVAEAIDLAKVREILGAGCETNARAFSRGTPEYVRFVDPPVTEPRGPITLKTGEQLASSIKYYSFAVVAVEIEVPFACGIKELQAQSSRWIGGAEVESAARGIVQDHLKRIEPAVTKPNVQWLQESYLVINVETIDGATALPAAKDLLETCGTEIVQLIRGEAADFAPKSIEAALEASASYYATDLVVVGGLAALVYDRGEDAAATTQVLELAKMQLLEFRYYDNFMNLSLNEVYATLARKRNPVFSRWTLPRDAQRANAIRLDVMDLTERIDNAVKFYSDAYYARLYQLAAKRMGVPDYRALVDEKLTTVGELYEFMVEQFDESRAFVLDVIVGLLALIDVLFLIKGIK
jgi:hypothetical protein